MNKENLKALRESDQLVLNMKEHPFESFQEADINFAPTFRFDQKNSNAIGTGSEKRTAAWRDRILFARNDNLKSYLQDLDETNYDKADLPKLYTSLPYTKHLVK